MNTEADFFSQRSEWMQLDREFQQRFLAQQQVHRKPGMFRNWRQFGVFCVAVALIWRFLIWGGKLLFVATR